MKVIVAGGGTAGHVFPAIAFARRMVDAHGADVRFVGTSSGLEARLVPQAGFPFDAVEARPFVRRLSPALLRAPVALLRSIRRCRPIVADADVVVGMGGYASGPAVAAAIRAGRPVVLHEQNAVPGLANRVFARPAAAVAVAFAEAAEHLPPRTRVVVTGTPIREPIAKVRATRGELADEARRGLGLEVGRRTVVVFGGSQGALHLDRAAVGAARLLAGREDLQMLLLTGPAHFELVNDAMPEASALLVRALPFLERMELAYAVADLVVCRAGATTIAEVTACALPSVLVPYPYATGRHQDANARAVERAGGAVVVADERLTDAELAGRIDSLIGDPERLAAMVRAAGAFGRPDAADRMADLVADVARGLPRKETR